MEISTDEVRNYYVDEAGCATLFAKRGKVIIGQEGCSKYFIMGCVEIADINKVEIELDNLRADLLSDPYFRKVPSMQPGYGKTAVAFHAKDDVPEVRREVFKVILRNEMKFHAEIRDKNKVLDSVIDKQSRDETFRYNDTFLYDSLTSRLFKNLLHKGSSVNIVFAKRGAKPRTDAFKASLQKAKDNFKKTWGIENNVPTNVTCSVPSKICGLQVVDYCLWALQRMYERNESRYIELIWDKVGCIHDIDSREKSAKGEYYTKKKPLNFSGFM